jgi:competence protein ComEC
LPRRRNFAVRWKRANSTLISALRCTDFFAPARSRANNLLDASRYKSDYFFRQSNAHLDLLPGEFSQMSRIPRLHRYLRSLRLAISLRILAAIALALCGATVNWSATLADLEKPLKVFFIDVEGGQATLFVTPAGESMLIDTGWPGFDGRDADRIAAAAKLAGVSKINYVLITHFHMDHVGGLRLLTARIPIETFIDHGDNREPGDDPTVQVFKAYQELLATNNFKRITPKPGDVLPIRGMHAEVVTSDGALIANPLPGAGGENPGCKQSEIRPADQTENPRSLGTLITFGKLRILDLGDLTWDKELQLMCPINKLGHVDVYIVSHHGWQQSGSPALVYGIAPRVAIMNNGAKKGGSPSAWDVIHQSPHLEDFWQIHYSEEGGPAHNVSNEFIANPEGPDVANYLQLTGNVDGSFAIYNSRTQKTKNYPKP